MEGQVSEKELETLKSLVSTIQTGAVGVKDSVASWRSKVNTSKDLEYPTGISLLSLKNHVLLSYIHHLIAVLQLKLSGQSLQTEKEGASVVETLIKLRVVLEKISPLEAKLKYQVEKLVRKADSAERGEDAAEDVMNDPLAFKPNPANLVLDRQDSDDESQSDGDMDGETGPSSSANGGIYRPPRIAAMPYVEGPSKKKKERALPSHLISDISSSLSSSTPYNESTSGLSVSKDASLQSSTARHLAAVEEYELANFTRMRMSKKESKKRRNEEEEVAFGGLGAGRGGKRRLGGFGAEFDDLLGGGIGEERRQGAYEAMKNMKKPKVDKGPREDRGTSGLAGLGGPGDGKGKRSKSTFDKAVKRAKKSRSG
ncbi:hypothetical protein T439DRAFT_381476 [Meredithblackwellia eburnea MCA 4105]